MSLAISDRICSVECVGFGSGFLFHRNSYMEAQLQVYLVAEQEVLPTSYVMLRRHRVCMYHLISYPVHSLLSELILSTLTERAQACGTLHSGALSVVLRPLVEVRASAETTI